MSSPFKEPKEEAQKEQGALGAFGGSGAFAALKEAGEADEAAEAASRPVSVSISVPPARRVEVVSKKEEHITVRMTKEFKRECVAAAARRGLRISSFVERLLQAVIEQDRATGLID